MSPSQLKTRSPVARDWTSQSSALWDKFPVWYHLTSCCRRFRSRTSVV